MLKLAIKLIVIGLLVLMPASCVIAQQEQKYHPDTLYKSDWVKVSGWQVAIGFTRNNYNVVSVDLGRYRTFRKSNPHAYGCAFGVPPLISRGVGIDMLERKNNTGLGLRLFWQADMIFGLSIRLDAINNFNDEGYSAKLRPGLGIVLGPMSLQYNYTFGLYNRDFLSQRHGISIRTRVNFNFRKKPVPGYIW